MIVTYYIKLFRGGADRINGILMPLSFSSHRDNYAYEKGFKKYVFASYHFATYKTKHM